MQGLPLFKIRGFPLLAEVPERLDGDVEEAVEFFDSLAGAARAGDIDQARLELATIIKLQAEAPEDLLPYWREELQVHVDVVSSWISLAEGDTESALQLAEAAANREDAVDKHPVTPGEVLPARELYADMLYQTGDYIEALENYQRVLASSPNRLNALLGAAQTAERLDNETLTEHHYSLARGQTRNGDGERARLQ